MSGGTVDTPTTSVPGPLSLVPNLDVKDDPDSKLIDEMDLDFEEISDGELEEEARVRGLGDALGVDWASLVQESRRIVKDPQETTAKQRWQPHRILLDIGVSYKMAGEKFATKLLEDAKQKLRLEKAALKRDVDGEKELIKNEVGGSESAMTANIKKEIVEEDEETTNTTVDEEKPTTVLKVDGELKGGDEKVDDDELSLPTHPIAVVQVAMKRRQQERKNLFANACGPFARGLSARRDLHLRRRLCGLPPSLSSVSPMKKQRKADPEAVKIAVQLFQKAVAKVA